MQEYFDSWRMELESHLRGAAKTTVATAARDKWSVVAGGYGAAVKRLDALPGAHAAGAATRAVTKYLAGLPGISAPRDFVQARNCVDLCEDDYQRHRMRPVVVMHLAEALAAARRDMLFIRALRYTADPTGLATATAIRTMAELGQPAGRPRGEQLVLRTHRLALKPLERTSVFDRQHGLARAYLLSGQPGCAVNLALRAAATAAGEAAMAKPRKGFRARMAKAWDADGLSGLVDELADTVGQSVNGNLGTGYLDAEYVPAHRLARMRGGIALTTAARGYLALGDPASAHEAAHAAVATGSTVGNEVLAALLTHADEPRLMDRVAARTRLLEQVRRIDHAHYHGHWRGDLRTGYKLVHNQTQRTVRPR